MKEKIVITGPTGAIGMALIKKCMDEEREILVICHKGSARNKRIPHSRYIHVVEADLDDITAVYNPASENKYDIFFHLAWRGTTGSDRNNKELQEANVVSALDAVLLAYKLGCHTFVGVGSQAEYGRVDGKLSTNIEKKPENEYGRAKSQAAAACAQLCREKNIKFNWVQVLSVFGPYDTEKSMISSTIKSLLEGKRAMLTKGEQKWDYLYSYDAAEALLLVAQKGVDGKTYVLGGGRAVKLREYITKLYEILEKGGKPLGELGFGDVPYADNQVMHLEADLTELTKDTGFIPTVPFEDGIKQTIAWIKQEMSAD